MFDLSLSCSHKEKKNKNPILHKSKINGLSINRYEVLFLKTWNKYNNESRRLSMSKVSAFSHEENREWDMSQEWLAEGQKSPHFHR